MPVVGHICHRHGGTWEPQGAERRLAAIAGAQGGAIGRGQLLQAGLTPRAIERRLESGRLHRIHPRAYAVGHTVLSGDGRWWAAVLSADGP